MRIEELIIYGDSTSLPRPKDSVKISDTWYWKLANFSEFNFSLENRSIGAIRISNLRRKILHDSDYLFPKDNASNCRKFVILNIGVVDAAILPVTYKLKAVNKLPIIGVYIWFFLGKILKPSRARIQRIWGYPNTKPSKFAKELDRIITFLKGRNVQICLLLTPIPHKKLDARSPGFRQNVIKYNNIKRDLIKKFSGINIVTLDKFKDSYYVSEEDGHHFSKLGHLYIFNRIKSEVNFESL